jgi:hypothetical protein
MTKRQRIFTYVAASVGVLAVGWVVLLGGIYLLGGVATVSVVEHDDDFRLSLPIPMALIHAAAATTEVFFLDDLVDSIEVETNGEYSRWAPAVAEMIEVLGDVPNGTVLVEVEDGNDHVLVSKVGGKFVVEVESPDLSVKVSVPTRSLSHTVARLAR